MGEDGVCGLGVWVGFILFKDQEEETGLAFMCGDPFLIAVVAQSKFALAGSLLWGEAAYVVAGGRGRFRLRGG